MTKTIKASAITGIGVATAVFLIMLFAQAGDNPVGYCESTGKFCIAVDGFSGGKQTRCYNESGLDWWKAPYCSEGWKIVSNDLEIENKTNETTNQTEINQTISQKPFSGVKYFCNPNKCVRED